MFFLAWFLLIIGCAEGYKALLGFGVLGEYSDSFRGGFLPPWAGWVVFVVVIIGPLTWQPWVAFWGLEILERVLERIRGGTGSSGPGK